MFAYVHSGAIGVVGRSRVFILARHVVVGFIRVRVGLLGSTEGSSRPLRFELVHCVLYRGLWVY